MVYDKVHVQKNCMAEGCNTEAVYWIPFDDSAMQKDTFYLCDSHALLLVGFDKDGHQNTSYTRLWPEQGVLEMVELAIYSCSSECAYCNE